MANKRVKAWRDYIPSGVTNTAIADWHRKQPPRVQTCASPSTLLDCPRVVWLRRHEVPFTNVMGWGKAQRLLLGRNFEDFVAKQLKEAGVLLHHWADNPGDVVDKFAHGEGLDKLTGVGDLLLQIGDKVAMSDAKTSRADSFLYVPIDPEEIFKDYFWYKYKIQVTAYYMLAHWNKDWFEKNKLPLPEICHLFSFALDDGVVRRDFTWEPTRTDADEVVRLTRRWNKAYNSPAMPECLCEEHEGKGVIFCPFGIMPTGSNVCTSCCDEKLGTGVNND